MGSASPICPHPQPWHCVIELRSPQTLSSWIIIFLQIKQDPFQLPAATPAWSRTPEPGGQVGSQQATGAGGGRCRFVLSLSYSHITGQLPGLPIAGAKLRCCLVLVTPQGIPPSFPAKPPGWSRGAGVTFSGLLSPARSPRFISASPAHGTQTTALGYTRGSGSPRG